MLVKEQYDENHTRTYSDLGFYIEGGEPYGMYEDAIDPVSAQREYIETNIRIEPTDDEYIESAKILLGEVDI